MQDQPRRVLLGRRQSSHTAEMMDGRSSKAAVRGEGLLRALLELH